MPVRSFEGRAPQYFKELRGHLAALQCQTYVRLLLLIIDMFIEDVIEHHIPEQKHPWNQKFLWTLSG